MLRLRKILLLNYVYYIFLIISLLIVLLTVNMPKISKYHPKETEVVGVLTSYHIDSSKLSLTLKGKEKLIGTYYFFNKKRTRLFPRKYKNR